MKRLLVLLFLWLGTLNGWAQAPSPAQVGITTAVPNVVQVYDSSHNWATIGTIDPVTHIFNVAGYTPYVLPTASTTVLGGVKVDGSTININGSGVISGTPAGITAGSTATSGFGANQILKSDGTKVQSVGENCTIWTTNPSYPMYICGRSSYPSSILFNAIGSNATGLGINSYNYSNSAGITINDGTSVADGYYSWVHQTNDVGTPGDAGFKSPAAAIISEIDILNPTVASAFRVYNIWTDDNNGEWGALDWKTVPNTLTIGSQNNGTGVQRPVNIVGNPVTINGASVGSIIANTTPTSGFTAGKLLYSDGTKVQPFGDTVGNLTANSSYPLYMAGLSYSNPTLWLSELAYAGAGNFGMGLTTYNNGDAGVSLDDQNGYSFFGFLTATNTVGSWNTGMLSQGPGIINMRSAYPMQFRVNNTFTDASNGEWGAFDWATTPNTLTIGTGANGTGTARGLKFVQGATTIMDYGVTYPNSIAFGASTAYVFPNSNATLLGSNANPWNGVYSSGYSVGPPSSTIAGVSCAAGTVNAATMVVTNGIVTHC
jgi:hypothetical protein